MEGLIGVSSSKTNRWVCYAFISGSHRALAPVFTIGRPFAGIVCLLLQLTLIGWVPAAIWSVYALGQYHTDKKIEEALGD